MKFNLIQFYYIVLNLNFSKIIIKLAPSRVVQSKNDAVQHLYAVCCKVTINYVAFATATNRIFSSCSTLLRANFTKST